jgi:bifunctional N-acetylglucosamine-1-phosphate-uridyltransferase/glucosamine-1-phosphate-acetyltransferase GlmU-like protein
MSTPPTGITFENWRSYAAPTFDPALWSAIVPAAGRGSRLGFNRPKILYPVAGRMILEWLVDLLLPCCRTMVFVLSPEGSLEVAPELERLAPGRYKIAVQEEPIGMGDAVEVGARQVTTHHALAVWGDQVALRPLTIEAILRLQQGPLNPAATVPTLLVRSPYIHFPRDEAGQIADVWQAREGDAMPQEGESDAGVFCFRSSDLSALLAELHASPLAIGRKTGEFNFLPIIPLAAQTGRTVLTPRVLRPEETIGVNNAADAQKLEDFLRSAANEHPSRAATARERSCD